MVATDTFNNLETGLSSPGENHFAITPDDVTELPNVTRFIHVGVGGDIVFVTRDGTSVTWKNCIQGDRIPIQAKQVKATGTLATNLVGVY